MPWPNGCIPIIGGGNPIIGGGIPIGNGCGGGIGGGIPCTIGFIGGSGRGCSISWPGWAGEDGIVANRTFLAGLPLFFARFKNFKNFNEIFLF
jgi:hypothetical protein